MITGTWLLVTARNWLERPQQLNNSYQFTRASNEAGENFLRFGGSPASAANSAWSDYGPVGCAAVNLRPFQEDTSVKRPGVGFGKRRFGALDFIGFIGFYRSDFILLGTKWLLLTWSPVQGGPGAAWRALLSRADPH